MDWENVQKLYPDQWLVIEALQAFSVGQLRHIEQLAVLAVCVDGSQALQSYRDLHHQYPQRELYFIHTSRVNLDIEEHHWAGIRG
jgi:hypothetical protein